LIFPDGYKCRKTSKQGVLQVQRPLFLYGLRWETCCDYLKYMDGIQELIRKDYNICLIIDNEFMSLNR